MYCKDDSAVVIRTWKSVTHPRTESTSDSSAILMISGMISSSSRRVRPPSVAPMFPCHQSVSVYIGIARSSITYDRPEYTFQLHDEVMIHALQTVLADEVGEFSEVALLLQDLVAKLSLGHHTIEVRRDHALEGPAI